MTIVLLIPPSIGAACALELASYGIHLALTFNSNEESVKKLIEALRMISGGSRLRFSTHQVDMSSTESIRKLFPAIEAAHNQLPDILISNAGRGIRIPDVIDIPLEEWNATLMVNLTSSFLLAQFCVPRMRSQRWGRIVFISSIAAYGGGINGCHYAASKGGLVGMTKNLATRLAVDGISVNDVAPAMIEGTGMIPNEAAVRGTPGDISKIPLHRLGSTEEVARLAGTCVRTGYMTGQSLMVTGGLK